MQRQLSGCHLKDKCVTSSLFNVELGERDTVMKRIKEKNKAMEDNTKKTTSRFILKIFSWFCRYHHDHSSDNLANK